MFFETAFATFIGAVAGGAIASIVAYYFTRRASSVEATYEVIHYVLSDEMSEKRTIARTHLADFHPKEIAAANLPDHAAYEVRKCLLSVLNYYDVVFRGVEDGMLDSISIQNAIWEIVRDDHIFFEPVLAAYVTQYKSKRPLFPSLRKFRELWG